MDYKVSNSNSEIMFAHSEYHHPSRGVTVWSYCQIHNIYIFLSQEFIFEEIRPTKTFLAESRTVVPAYHVLTHTSRITNTVEPQISTSHDSDKIRLMLQDFIPQLLPTAPLPLTTTYTTITITKVSTITSDVTSDITITLGGRPVKTEYVVPTTMVSNIMGLQHVQF